MDETSRQPDDDRFHEECGVFGIFGHADAAALTALGLHALQHRGQEAAGIVATDGTSFHAHRGRGQVGENFGNPEVIGRLVGDRAIGHTRYATTGEASLRNVQPLYADFAFGGCAVAHNGNLTNAWLLRRGLVERGSIFQSTSDTEVFIHLIANAPGTTMAERLAHALSRVQGAYSLLAMTEDAIYAARDPAGVRPLQIGALDGATIVTSESCALDIIGAEFVRDVKPGELLIVTRNGIESRRPLPAAPRRFCIFEYIYFARPDSVIESQSVYAARRAIGAELAREAPVPADLVVPVPDSGVPAAIGYAGEAGLPFELGIISNHYVGRTFIEPTDQIRHLGVRLKHNANRAYLEGKRVVLVDDSIVRGTTSRKIVDMVRRAGATEVHMRISSPPTTHSCFYGIDTPDRAELLATGRDVAQMAEMIGVDSLAFISIDGLYRALGQAGRAGADRRFCDACFTGDYPIPLTDNAAGGAGARLSRMQVADGR